MTTDPENLPSLDDESLQALITQYTGLKYKLSDNVRVRERLVELQDEQLKRQIEALGNYEPIGDDMKTRLNSTIEGVIRQNTDNPLENQ
tara:strand:- start:3880 stop:4146 length:267 start_codon:yes stop_codon:yes gene_type:complete